MRKIEEKKDRQTYTDNTRDRISLDYIEYLKAEEPIRGLTPYERNLIDGYNSSIEGMGESFKAVTDIIDKEIQITVSDMQKALSYFSEHYGKIFESYKIYCLFIEKQLLKPGYSIYATLEIAKAYIEAYKKESAPEQISETEQEQIIKFIEEYLSEERKPKIPPSIEPIPRLSDLNGFVRMLQGTGTNKLAQMSSRRMIPQIDPITGTATVSYKNFTAYIDNFNSLSGLLSLNAIMLLDVCILYLSRLNEYGKDNNLETAISIPLEEYMSRCDIPITKASKDKTRREAKEALETLYNLSIEFDEEKTVNGKKVNEHYHTRILQDRSEIKNGIVYARFGQTFIKYLNACGLMEYSTALLKIDRRNPTVYHIGRKLCYQSSLDNNRAKGNANKLSVAKLLDCCPDIPSYEEVSETDRHYDRRIIDPFEEALDALKNKYNIIGSWEYCNKGEAPLTDEQLNNFSYDTFIKLLIKYDIKNAPDPKDRLAAKAETIKKRNAKKRAAINKTCKKKAESTEPQSEG